MQNNSKTKFNKYNFHKHTFCVFTEVSDENLDFSKANFVSKTQSAYIFSDEGVYRKSNHWGRVANCKWKLVMTSSPSPNRIKIGFARWEDFRDENITVANYVITYDPSQKTVDFLHHEHSNEPKSLVRNSEDTTKRIKEIRKIISDRKWMEYYPIENEDAVLNEIIFKMIQTNIPFRLIVNEILRKL